MTRRTLTILFALLLLTTVTAAQAPTPAAKFPGVAGKWTMAMELSIGTSNPILVLKQDGDKLTGTYQGRYGESKLTGKIGADRQLQFTVALEAEGQSATMFFSGELAADGQLITKGIVNIEGLGEGSWAAKKAS